MAIYRFRIAFEEYDDVYRDVEIRSLQNFEELHSATNSHVGSFPVVSATGRRSRRTEVFEVGKDRQAASE